MAYSSHYEAYVNFQSRYDESEFSCEITKIASGYVYKVITKAQAEKKANRAKNTPVVNPLVKSALAAIRREQVKDRAKKKKYETTTKDENLDEALRAVKACAAKRKKPVPYAREEIVEISRININDSVSDRKRCIYCGDHRSGIVRDHVVSVAWRGGVRNYDRSHVVPSCPQCNSLLGDKPIHNVADRAAFLVGAIEHHERRFLSTVDRTPEELAEMDHFLAVSVKGAMFEKAVALSRIEYAKQVAAGFYDYATIKHLVKQGRDLDDDY